MATNFYHTDQRIHFGGEPASYWGYYITTSGGAAEFFPYASEHMRQMHEKKVKDKLEFEKSDANAFRVAAALSIAEFGDDGWDEVAIEDLEADLAQDLVDELRNMTELAPS